MDLEYKVCPLNHLHHYTPNIPKTPSTHVSIFIIEIVMRKDENIQKEAGIDQFKKKTKQDSKRHLVLDKNGWQIFFI